MRHPGYLSFLGLTWFTPDMTIDRAILTGLWTVYIFAGSWFKDQRLVYYMGNMYREYQTRVPGYPGLFFSPLGRLKLAPPSGPAAPLVPTATVATTIAVLPAEHETLSPARAA